MRHPGIHADPAVHPPASLTRRVAAAALLAAAFLLAGGCALTAPAGAGWPSGLPQRQELVDTPYHPQDALQCGPATLAMVLGAIGLPASPAALAEAVFVPARQGSLQIEMLAAARRHGAVAVEIADGWPGLLAELAAGRPVVVLQNLGPWFAPVWHYAVAIGFDRSRDALVLRSGGERRQLFDRIAFERSWQASGRWGFTVLRPGDWPVAVDAARARAALVAFERAAPAGASLPAWRSASDRWPGEPLFALGAGNAWLQAGELEPAAAAFERAASGNGPGAQAGAYNLALTLERMGRLADARAAARRASAASGPWRDASRALADRLAPAAEDPRPGKP